jgi:multidrug resistance efflux pump
VQSAQAQRERARAELAQVQAGAWVYDIRKAEADLQTMRSRIREIQVKLNQSVVRSPIDGQVLQVNIRPGEFAGLRETTPLMLLGNTDTLQVRVDVDEVNASRVRPGMAGTATLKGEPKAKFPLRFVRVEPYMVPKKNLSGSNLERVDVRVLQLIYEFSPPQYPVYVGQQVDVFLDKSS